ncbi:energy transducer TonB [Pedobacter sp. SYP-B3415]|uniref:energy transducer TonB n=1 Tax=Pedobacter sp. SYP-B3415 TaxID=2496641 RepID=UPI00101D6C64|nr:energy transducer TonB [Pedobacter sp. SYP-B3415]
MFNSAFNVYKTEWLEIVFNNRNKQYGAYQLRAASSRILLFALTLSSAVFIGAFFIPVIYAKLFPKAQVKHDQVTTVNLEPIHELKPPKVEKPAEQRSSTSEKIKSTKWTSNIAVVNKEVTDTPPTVDELKNTAISNVTQDGLENVQIALPHADTPTNGSGSAPAKTADNEVYSSAGVEVYPQFVGGQKAWEKYIQRTLRYPSEDIQGKVQLSFVVEKDGSVSNVQVLKSLNAACDAEAIRVISKSPKWIPGVNNGLPVRVRYTMGIAFSIGK